MPEPSVARTERPRTEKPGSAKRVEGRGEGRSTIFHRFRVQANFNNIRSIRYSRPHIKSVRANEAPPERRNMMSGGRRVKRGGKRTREVARRGGGEERRGRAEGSGVEATTEEGAE